MNTPTTPGGVIDHSTLVGGSSAAKRLMCPGSYQMEQKLPPGAGKTSSKDADEGSALHDCIAYMLDNDIVDLKEIEGMIFRDHVMTDKLIEGAIRPAMAFFDALCDASIERGEGELQFLVEKRCELPGIPNAFGTSDIIFRNEKRSGILDWKFGAGVPVAALYLDDENGDLVNPQLMFYARAAMHTYPGFFPGPAATEWPIEVIIYQPRVRADIAKAQLPDDRALTYHFVDEHDPAVTYAVTSQKELGNFRDALVRAIAEATSPNPKIAKGEHCRFAACKTICPLWTGPALDLTKLIERKKVGETLGEYPNEQGVSEFSWAQFYADGLELFDNIDVFRKEFMDQAHQFISAGRKIPGWKLVDKRGTEKYVDEPGAVRHVIGVGVDPDDVYAPREVKSPAQLRATLEPLMPGKTKKDRTAAAKEQIGKFTEVVSSGTSLAREDDNRQGVITAGAAAAALGEKLKLLTSS